MVVPNEIGGPGFIPAGINARTRKVDGGLPFFDPSQQASGPEATQSFSRSNAGQLFSAQPRLEMLRQQALNSPTAQQPEPEEEEEDFLSTLLGTIGSITKVALPIGAALLGGPLAGAAAAGVLGGPVGDAVGGAINSTAKTTTRQRQLP